MFCSSVYFCEKKNAPSLKDGTHVTRWGVLSLTEHTEFTELFGAQFRAHRRPPAYRVHRALLLKVAVRFCDICRPQGLCGMLCVLFICVICEKKNIFETRWGVFSLTELTDLTELFNQRFELTERLRHTEFTEASPPAPLRMERGVVCEVTPIGLLIEGDRLLNIWRTCRGISVITPLSIRRGAGGEASVGCKVL